MEHAELDRRIQNMGYILAVPKDKPTPSYYELGDGTILSVLVNVNHILMDASKSGLDVVNHTTDIRVYVPHRSVDGIVFPE